MLRGAGTAKIPVYPITGLFEVVPSNVPDTRAFLIRAESNQEAMEWVHAITSVLNGKETEPK